MPRGQAPTGATSEPIWRIVPVQDVAGGQASTVGGQPSDEGVAMLVASAGVGGPGPICGGIRGQSGVLFSAPLPSPCLQTPRGPLPPAEGAAPGTSGRSGAPTAPWPWVDPTRPMVLPRIIQDWKAQPMHVKQAITKVKVSSSTVFVNYTGCHWECCAHVS